MGCGASDTAPKHRIAINASHDEVAFHYDCHARTVNGCGLCQVVVDTHPDLKDDQLAAALVENFPASPGANTGQEG